MLGLFTLILLCMMCTTVTPTYFNWTRINGLKGDEKTEVNYSGLSLKSIDDISYVIGNFSFDVNFNQSDPSYYDYRIHYYMINEKIEPGKISESVTAAYLSVCGFFDWMFNWNLLPMTYNHNDFALNGTSVCPIEARMYHIYEVDKRSQLNADSDLPEGDHTIQVLFCKDSVNVGGFEGHFYSSNKKLE